MGPPPRQRETHTARNVTLIVIGALIVFIGIGVALSNGKTPARAAGSAATTAPAPTTAPAATTPPAATAAVPRVLMRFIGSGIRNSAPFNVGNGPLTITYHFNCASFGAAGNFAADLLYGNQSSLNSDDQSIANALAMSGGQTTTVYPQDPGQDYYLSVDSECSWRIRVVSG